jgi:hypothetical protein
MASTAISAAQADIIKYVALPDEDGISALTSLSSLTQDEIPAKLRCAMCSRLAVNAFRLPCCEQAICENCELTENPANDDCN